LEIELDTRKEGEIDYSKKIPMPVITSL